MIAWHQEGRSHLVRLDVFGVAVGPAASGFEAYLFFWGGRGRDGHKHPLGLFEDEAAALAEAVPTALQVLRGAAPCVCSYVEPCVRHRVEFRRKHGLTPARSPRP